MDKLSLIFEPVIGWPLLTLCTALGLLIGLWFLSRSLLSGFFRLLTLILLIAMLANPQLVTDQRTPLENIVIVFSDQSQSQKLDNRDTITKNISERLTNLIESRGPITIRNVDITGTEQTEIITAFNDVIADIPREQLAAIFLITDGQIADLTRLDENQSNVPAIIRSIAPEIPFHVFLSGQESEIDRKITLTNAPRYGIVRENIRVSFRIDDLGPNGDNKSDGSQIPVVLSVDGKVLLRQAVPTGRSVGFDVPLDRPGKLIIELSVDLLSGELTDKNNTAVLPITAVRDRLRVLLISGEPNPSGRVWRNLLKSDPSIDMVHFTILRTGSRFDPTPPNELALIPFPTDELFRVKLKEFDLIIFDRYSWRNQLRSYHFDNIARFVEEGGAMLVASGPEYNSALSLARRRTLSYLLPALPNRGSIETPFRPLITEIGKRHPVTAQLPDRDFWGRWQRLIPTTVRRGITLMSGPDDTPLLVLDRVGKGRVGMLQSDHVWLWARGFDGGGPHGELLRRTAHWLMQEPQLEEESLTLLSAGNTLTVERRSLGDDPGPAILTLPDGSTRTIELEQSEPGLFRKILSNMPTGLYRANAGELFTIGAIGLAAAPEFTDVVSDGRKLSPLVEHTGGGIFRPRQNNDNLQLPAIRLLKPRRNRDNDTIAARHAAGWAGIMERGASQLDGRKTSPFLPPIAWLTLIALTLALAWAIESRGGGKQKINMG